MDEWILIESDTALYNAGVLGLYRLLKYANAEKDADYCLTKEGLRISKKYLLEVDLAPVYLELLREWYGGYSRVQKFIQTDYTTADYSTGDNKLLDSFEKYWKNKTPFTVLDMLIDTGALASCPLRERVEEFQAVNGKHEPEEKRRRAASVVDVLKEFPVLYEALLEADIAMNHLKDFFGNFAFLRRNQGNYMINDSLLFDEALRDSIFTLLKNYLQFNMQTKKCDSPGSEQMKLFTVETKPKKSKRGFTECMQCRTDFQDKQFAVEATFLNDFVDDIKKKPSTFWNKNADAFLCPICKLVYGCMPFGFFLLGNENSIVRDKMFINVNDSVTALESANRTAMEQAEGNRMRAINAVVLQELQQKENELNSIEVVLRVNQYKRNFYSYDILSPNTIRILKKSKKELYFLNPCTVKIKDEYIDVMRECLNNILGNRNQWNLLHRILSSGYRNTAKLMNLLLIQVQQNNIKEENSLDYNKLVYVASKKGKELRNNMEDADNKLRGFAYKLTNALSTGNRDLFMDTIMRLYSGLKLPVPDILIRLFDGEESFKEIGYGYLLGMKGEEKKDDKNTENKEQVNGIKA